MSAVAKVRSTAAAAWDSAPRLRIAQPAKATAPRAPFVLVIIVLVVIGLGGLIFISTVLQRQAFVIADLDTQINDLSNQRQAMSRELDRMQSPAGLGQEAIRLGMVPNTNPVFIRISDGEIIGDPVPAEAGTNIGRVTR